jgi:multiple antibiotic resistance protein
MILKIIFGSWHLNLIVLQKKMNLFLVCLGSLFSVINPLGTVPVFMGLTDGKTKQQMISIAVRTSINVLIILLISFFVGSYLLSFFGISMNSLKIAGGLIIASSGFALITGSFTRHKGMRRSVKEDAMTRSQITLTPLAIPMLAGPGAISLLISYKSELTTLSEISIVIASIVAVTLATLLLLLASRQITKVLGASGMNSLSRIIGFIVTAIGIEFILSAVYSFVVPLTQ